MTTAKTTEFQPQPGLPTSSTHLASSFQLARSEVQGEGGGGDLTEVAPRHPPSPPEGEEGPADWVQGCGEPGQRAGSPVGSPKPLESQNLRGWLRPGHFPSRSGSGESPGNHPSHPDPLGHISKQATSPATAQFQPNSGLAPCSPTTHTAEKGSMSCQPSEGKERRGSQGWEEGDGSPALGHCLPPSVRDGEPPADASARVPCPPPHTHLRSPAGPRRARPSPP